MNSKIKSANSIAMKLSAFLIVSATLFPPFYCFSNTGETSELFPQGNAESEGLLEVSGARIPRTSEAVKDGQYAFELSKRQFLTLAPIIPIDPGNTYHLSVSLRTAEIGKPASANFGVSMYDQQKRHIGICNVSPVEGTDTNLLKPLQVGDKEVWVKDARAWKVPAEHHRIAFQTRSDHSDLPNFQLSTQIEMIVETPEGWKATLREPAKIAYPTGTPIRQHVAWEAGLYWVANDWVPLEWTSYSTTLSGIHPKGTTADRFWKGTRYIRIIVRLGNWDRIPEEGARLLIDDISFREVNVRPMQKH